MGTRKPSLRTDLTERPAGPVDDPSGPRGVQRQLADLLDAEAVRLEERRRELANARELVRQLPTMRASGQSGSFEAIPAELAAVTVSRLLERTTGEMRNLVMIPDDGPALDDTIMRQIEERIKAGAVHRTLYPASVLDSPSSFAWVRSWAIVGEQQRVTPSVSSEFAVFGESAVVALARWGDATSGYVISRDPLVVALHCAFFDLLWRQAHPVARPSGDQESDARLIELLGLGLKDEAIARLTGVGLRTVRRRVAALMLHHGVDNRYQLGWAIGRATGPSR